jgi:TPR repeat protein
MLNLNGLGGLKKNTEKGLSFLEKAVNAGNREAAMELGKYYRNLGDTEKALSFYKKGCDEKDSGCNRLQAEIYAKSNPTLNKEQCERIRVAKYPETAPEYTDYLTCTFTGLISDMTKDQAGKKLKEQLIKSPNVNGLIKLGPELLKQSSLLFDLVEFENITWRIDPDLKNNEIKNLAKAAGINEDIIADMPNFTEEQKRSRISASFVAALGGNIKRTIYVGKYFSSNASSDLSQLPKAKSILSLIESEKDSLDYKKIQLNIYKAESLNSALKTDVSHKLHLTLLGDISKVEKKDDKFIGEHFSHQYFLAKRFISNDSPPFTVDMVFQLANSVAILDIADIQSTGLIVLQQLEKKYRTNLDENDETDLRKKEKLNNIASITNELIKRGIQPAKTEAINKPKDNTQKQETPTNEQIKRSETKSIKENVSSAAAPKASEYSKFKYECDQNIGQSCTKAAEILLGSEVPDDYRTRSSRERKEAAIKLLEKANDLKDLSGAIMLYDTLDSETNMDAREKANALLKQRNLAESVSGQLRKYARELKFDPLRTPTNLLLRKKETKAQCDQVEKLKSSSLSAKDNNIAADIISGFTCRGVQNPSVASEKSTD